MPWTYSQTTGQMLDPNGNLVATGYSGLDVPGGLQGKNNPDAENVPNVGPTPRGTYQIGPAFDSNDHGPIVMHLVPEPGTDTLGRSGFLIHGDSVHAPGTASHGCVIMPRPVREAIAASPDRELEVTV
jgi:type VI secretion system (T6SS) effector TldE1-like protein